jgi:hypothetical protein
MAEEWPEYATRRTREQLESGKWLERNGKIFFKRTDRSRAFIYEAELQKGMLHLRPERQSHTFTHYESVAALLADGWAIE